MIADLSVNHVERFLLRCGWTVQRTTHDYGLDMTMDTYSVTGEIESGRVHFQLKATDKLKLNAKQQAVTLRLEWRDIEAWRKEPMPVILVLYDAREDKGYWLHVQSYFRELRRSVKGHGITTTVYLPVEHVVDEAAVRQFAQFRDIVVSRIQGVLFYEEQDNIP